MSNKGNLTNSEWTIGIKMVANSTDVRAHPGKPLDMQLCRYSESCKKIETLQHVLGNCPHGELLRTNGHNKVRTCLANALRKNKLEVYEEISCTDSNGDEKRADIIAINPRTRDAVMFDPTIRFEQSQIQPEEVNREKQDWYKDSIPVYIEKLNLRSLKIIGLLVGARGTITNLLVNTCQEFGIPDSVIEEISTIALRRSCQIYLNHVSSTRT